MQTLHINDKEYYISYTGESVMIAMDELHSDFFRMADSFQYYLYREEMPLMDITAKLMYCGIKAVSPESFRTFKDFMQSIRKLSVLVKKDNLKAINDEISETYETIKEDDSAESKNDSEDSKKKVTENL